MIRHQCCFKKATQIHTIFEQRSVMVSEPFIVGTLQPLTDHNDYTTIDVGHAANFGKKAV